MFKHSHLTMLCSCHKSLVVLPWNDFAAASNLAAASQWGVSHVSQKRMLSVCPLCSGFCDATEQRIGGDQHVVWRYR